MRRQFSKRQRLVLRLVAGDACNICGAVLGPNFHADHRLAFSRGGRTILNNGQALCPPCNLKKGAR